MGTKSKPTPWSRWTIVLVMLFGYACSGAGPASKVKRAYASVSAERWLDALAELDALFKTPDRAFPQEERAALRLMQANCMARCDRGADARRVLLTLLNDNEVSAGEYLDLCTVLVDEGFLHEGLELMDTGLRSFPDASGFFRIAFRETLTKLATMNGSRGTRISPRELEAQYFDAIQYLDAPGPGYRRMADPDEAK